MVGSTVEVAAGLRVGMGEGEPATGGGVSVGGGGIGVGHEVNVAETTWETAVGSAVPGGTV